MLLNELLSQNEGKTLEFKENASNYMKIVKAIVAFSNTAGGVIVIGIRDKTKEIIGVENVLYEEEKISNYIVDLIEPMIIPDIDVVNHEGKELLLINVPHLAGPFHLKKSGMFKGTYVRLGSTNRQADPETLANLQRFAKRISFDELPCVSAGIDELDAKLIQDKVGSIYKNFSKRQYESLGLIGPHNKKKYATNGGILLFAKDKTKWLPDSIVKCVSYSGVERRNILDKREVKVNLIDTVEEVMLFVHRNTKIAAEVGAIRRTDIPEYPTEALREAVINAIVHADYSIKGASIQVSIYSDRIEIINPGCLPFGQSMSTAMSGVSKMRNPIIGRIFREIGIIETLGMGMFNIVNSYKDLSAKDPQFEEIDNFFKVTLFARDFVELINESWAKILYGILMTNKEVSPSEMAKIWGVTVRTSRNRLNRLLEIGYLKRNAKSKTDPHATYSKK